MSFSHLISEIIVYVSCNQLFKKEHQLSTNKNKVIKPRYATDKINNIILIFKSFTFKREEYSCLETLAL